MRRASSTPFAGTSRIRFNGCFSALARVWRGGHPGLSWNVSGDRTSRGEETKTRGSQLLGKRTTGRELQSALFERKYCQIASAIVARAKA
jgi:hypothetical protein